ncbi:TonB-dependent receptor domain-containing protein [Sphingomonas sp. Leaf231]|uniref:TonB-dependent receptor domain-containing protein n=1 Tax=Sphingomonas sp. Leaf231 TaxID=1736301 RepID=UPI000A6B2781|nr:TonB-dependent receptor [Sphingomonas sp. Leaf231]
MPKSLIIHAGRAGLLAGVALPSAAIAQQVDKPTAWQASRTVNDSDSVTTGVAKGRDRLDSATSTSITKENEISKLAPRSLADLFRNIPGIRVEAAAGEGGNGYTVRGLPLVADGAKFVQIQEDGLPVMEFGDLFEAQADHFIRADFNVGQVESIRGGSASTFASNGPGGVINLISKTGEVEGGSMQASTGIGYDSARVDFDYGGHLSDRWRFHIGGFYRSGEGPRSTGFTTFRGGQIKFNVTREFDGGHIRLYGKLLDDHSPLLAQYPVSVTGTNQDPKFSNVAGFPLVNNTLLSSYITTNVGLQPDGQAKTQRYRDGIHAKAKSGGGEVQFHLADWTITERFRYSQMSIVGSSLFPVFAGKPDQLGTAIGVPDATFSYAGGPLSGQAFNPARGSGLLALSLGDNTNTPDVDNLTNDLRASRVWKTGAGDLTTTLGIYKARQDYQQSFILSAFVQDVQPDGRSSILDITRDGGRVPVTQGGYLLFTAPGSTASIRSVDVAYDVTAPYGSFNLQHGRVAIGGSLRYDFNRVSGDLTPSQFGCFDFNRDGVTSAGSAECQTAVFSSGAPRPIDYDHGYLSYSTGINVRLSDPLAIFGRYSRGGRAAGDALLASPAISPQDGSLVDKSVGNDSVRQAEIGVKFRRDGLTLNVTAFHAKTRETTGQVNLDENGNSRVAVLSRGSRAYGAELEGSLRRGPFRVTASGTMVDAEITAAEDPALVGNTPRHQPALIYQLTPQYDADAFTIGANVVGVTGSYAQDLNQLRLPAYTTVGVFVQVRPIERLELSVNATNVLNTMAITETLEASIPANNIALARTLYGRMVSASARFFF